MEVSNTLSIELDQSTNLIKLVQDKGAKQEIWLTFAEYIRVDKCLEKIIKDRDLARQALNSWEP